MVGSHPPPGLPLQSERPQSLPPFLLHGFHLLRGARRRERIHPDNELGVTDQALPRLCRRGIGADANPDLLTVLSRHVDAPRAASQGHVDEVLCPRPRKRVRQQHRVVHVEVQQQSGAFNRFDRRHAGGVDSPDRQRTAIERVGHAQELGLTKHTVATDVEFLYNKLSVGCGEFRLHVPLDGDQHKHRHELLSCDLPVQVHVDERENLHQ
mmetsp:Transcript_23168/g.57655  ORF Transcript_23168/g.57655 Transcript_23168/m.57655 type:complete len:210 (+) Transcript_23168:550-1179(+)